jgi:uncharacterized repeat protein (TIGR04076 family)
MSKYKIELTVKEIKGVCDMHKVGDKAEVVGDEIKGRICAMALHTLFPFIFAMQDGDGFPWLEDDACTAYCPDPLGLALFEMKRSKMDD